jgi:hypothetical protein
MKRIYLATSLSCNLSATRLEDVVTSQIGVYWMWYRNLTYYYYRASSIEFGQVPLAIYTETRTANTEKIQEKSTAREMAKLKERDGEQTNPVESNSIR